jgi:hypothetical protein
VRILFGGPAHRRATVAIGLVLVVIAITLLSIGANSPYTHANLAVRYDDRYDRTEQIVVGQVGELQRGRLDASVAGADRGEALFVAAGCVACHALDGGGGTVAKAIAGADPALIVERVRGGTAGMPRFSPDVLTDDQLAEIASYLRSLGAAR